MEFRFGKFGEFVIEELHEGVDVVCGVLRIRDSLSTVRVTDLHGRIEEDHVGVVVPRILVELRMTIKLVKLIVRDDVTTVSD